MIDVIKTVMNILRLFNRKYRTEHSVLEQFCDYNQKYTKLNHK